MQKELQIVFLTLFIDRDKAYDRLPRQDVFEGAGCF